MTRRNLENNELGGVIREKINDNFIDLYNATGRGVSVLPTLATRFGVSNRIYNGAQFVDEAVTTTYSVTRNSTATYVDPTGKIRIAGVNEPRFTFDPETGDPLGLLVEEQRTNLFTWSDDFSNPAWAKVNGLVVTPTTINGVVQSTTFTEIDDFDTNSSRYLRQIITVPNNSSTYSAWGIFKKSTSSVVSCRLSLTGGTAVFGSVDYNFDTDTFSSSANITTERRLMRDSSVMLIWKITNNGTGNTTLDARFFSTGAGGGVGKALINVLQLEQASTPSSYIPTEASAVTRLADNVSRTFNAEWNAFEGCFVVESRAPVGQTIATVGAQTIVSDSAQFKKYALHYSTLNAATTIVMGNGSHRSLEYRPKQLTSAQREALLK